MDCDTTTPLGSLATQIFYKSFTIPRQFVDKSFPEICIHGEGFGLTTNSVQDIYALHARLQSANLMRKDSTTVKRRCRQAIEGMVSQSCCILLAAVSAIPAPLPKTHAEETSKLTVRVEAPSADVLKAVQEVTQDQIIHGTYSYEKERILYGAHSANSAHVFGVWQGQGTASYKVASNVLSPRFFKDTGDIGTISVRYIVQDATPDAAILQIEAIFVDARNVRHPSEGNVESSEYAAIQEQLRKIRVRRQQAEEGTANVAANGTPPAAQPPPGSWQPATDSNASALSLTVPELQKRIEALRHQVELRVKDRGAQLKSAPFHSAATLQSVPAQTEVLIVVVSPYWYGVETDVGHRGWIHHSQLDPLP